MADLLGMDVGRYHIMRQLGEGGMATVYKAFDTRLERDVAVKFIRREVFSPVVVEHMLKRFEREAKALARLSHPNIVHVHDYGEYEGSPYLVMEYVPGGTLKDLAGRPMDASAVARLLAPIARALEYAHEQNVIHRDVKPVNILLTAKGQPMLSDFGIAKILEQGETTLTGAGVGVGTPEYMSPEQGLGRGVDHRTDIYALGVVFYELLTGRKPYTADTPMAVVMKHCNDPLPPLRNFAPAGAAIVAEVPEGAEKIVFKALAKEPANRYQTMSEMAAALERLGGWTTSPAISIKPNGEQPVPPAPQEVRVVKEPVKVIKTAETPIPQVEITVDELAPKSPPTISAPMPPIQNQIHSGKPMQAGLGLLAIGAAAAGLFFALGGNGLMAGPAAAPRPTLTYTAVAAYATAAPAAALIPTQTQTSSPTAAPTSTPAPASTPTPTTTPTSRPTSTPGIGSTRTAAKDGMVMVYVPEGEFLMGNDSGEVQEKPAHKVYLDGYWIDRTEVTNAMYTLCVKAGVCKEPTNKSSNTHGSYYGTEQYGDYPVIWVDWDRAKVYCDWIGRRLPTEAEWEKAAHGTDGRIYPWGNSQPDCNTTNYFGKNAGKSACFDDTNKVGSYPKGASPYGVLDMAGNAWEWVLDFYQPYYYTSSLYHNPQGPSSGSTHGLRGGSWADSDKFMRTLNRLTRSSLKYVWNGGKYYYEPYIAATGFRCAQSADSP